MGVAHWPAFRPTAGVVGGARIRPWTVAGFMARWLGPPRPAAPKGPSLPFTPLARSVVKHGVYRCVGRWGRYCRLHRTACARPPMQMGRARLGLCPAALCPSRAGYSLRYSLMAD